MKKLAAVDNLKSKLEEQLKQTLQEIENQGEKDAKELEERKANAKQVFESKVQDLYLEMETKLEEKKQEIQLNHEKEINNLTEEHAKHLEELKSNFQLTDDMKLPDDIAALKEELESLKEQIKTEKQELAQLQKEKLKFEEHKSHFSELLQEKEMLKKKNEKESEKQDKLLQEKALLQNQITELNSELAELNKTLQYLATNKCALESEITLIKEELNQHKSSLQQTKHLPTAILIDKCTATSDILLNADNISEKEKCNASTSYSYEQEKESDIIEEHSASCGFGEADRIPYEEDKMQRLEIKMEALEKAFRLLENKIESTVDSALLHDHRLPSVDDEKIPKAAEKCKCCSEVIHTDIDAEVANNVPFSSKQLKGSCYLHNIPSHKYSVFHMPNNICSDEHYKNNFLYSVYSKDLNQQEMNVALSPVYISENDTELFPFTRSDTAIQLEHCKEKFRKLQTKQEASHINLELIKKEIFNNLTRKDADTSNEMQNLRYEQISDQLNSASQLGSQYTCNILPRSTLTDMIAFPTNGTVQNDEWNATLWQKAQHFIQTEQQLKDIEKENNPLEQFLTLTEAVLDKELELFSKDKVEKHYLSYPSLNKRHSSNNFISLESFDKTNVNPKRNATYSDVYTNYKPIRLEQSTPLRELITEKEDWMEKIGSMYQKIRTYERDFVLKRSLKSNI